MPPAVACTGPWIVRHSRTVWEPADGGDVRRPVTPSADDGGVR
jgi:hypothetical protein